MFGWFATKCPLGTWEKTWTETRMCWLAQKLGIDRLMKAEVILPTERHFPDAYDGDVADVVRMMERIRGYMGIAPETVTVDVCADEAIPEAAGVYYQRPSPGEKSLIYIAVSQLAEPMRLAATLSHELAHEILLGGEILTESVGDHEWITDLLLVYLGVGVFAANSTVYDRTIDYGTSTAWVIGKQGYLPSRMYGYALALFAWVRGETDPDWTRHLRRDARTAFEEGMRYLWGTVDSVFRPAMDHLRPLPLSSKEAVERLRAGSATVRLATLWDIEREGLTTPECLGAVTARLHDRDPAVAGDAARLLPRFGVGARSIIPALLGCLDSASEVVRAGACEALGELGTDGSVVKNLAFLLRDESHSVVAACAGALARLGFPLDGGFAADLMGRLEKALIECDHPMVQSLATALLVTVAKPKQAIRDYFDGKDSELRRLTLHAVEEQRAKKAGEGQGLKKSTVPLPERLPPRPPPGLPG